MLITRLDTKIMNVCRPLAVTAKMIQQVSEWSLSGGQTVNPNGINACAGRNGLPPSVGNAATQVVLTFATRSKNRGIGALVSAYVPDIDNGLASGPHRLSSVTCPFDSEQFSASVSENHRSIRAKAVAGRGASCNDRGPHSIVRESTSGQWPACSSVSVLGECRDNRVHPQAWRQQGSSTGWHPTTHVVNCAPENSSGRVTSKFPQHLENIRCITAVE